MTPQEQCAVERWAAEHRGDVIDDLCALVAVDTTSPHEERCFPLLEQWCASVGLDTALESIHPAIVDDPDRAHNDFDDSLLSRTNLRARGPRLERARTTLFSAHVDVVPPSHASTSPFSPQVRGATVAGRGAADTKNNIAMLIWALRAVQELGLRAERNVACDFVIEEEVGGNGALSTVLHGVDADEVVVLEPTGLVVHHGHRGYLTFEADVAGAPAHVGSKKASVSAIDVAFRLVGELRAVETLLRADAAAHPDFGDPDAVVRLNIGRIQGGEWHGSIPEHCRIGGSVGYVPGRSVDEVQRLLRECVSEADDPALGRTSFTFEGIRNEAYVADSRMPLAAGLRSACAAAGVTVPAPLAWNVSCDARLYHHRAGLPTVVFGSGDLDQAHTAHETVNVEQILRGIVVLVAFLTSGDDG